MDLLQAVLHGLTTAFTFLIVITVLIAVHELGHYWFAKLCGMHVTAFAVMVGGLRKTPLDSYLKKPLVKSSILWLVGTVIAILTVLAGFYGQKIAFYAGLAFFATVGPLWLISRLNALYHRPFTDGIFNLLKCYAVVIIILAIGTRFQNLDPVYALSMLIGAASVAVMLAYYYPVIRTGGADPHDPAIEAVQGTPFLEGEGNKGFGEIVADHKSIAVRFRPLLSKIDRNGTEFSLLLLPLGGFASIYGMQAREDGSETGIDRGFFSKSPLKRLVVLFAGPLFSILLGVLLIFGGVLGQGKETMNTVVGNMSEGPAQTAGIKLGDKITAINGEPTPTFYDVIEKVRFSYKQEGDKFEPIPVQVTVDRKGEQLTLTAIPEIGDKPTALLDKNISETAEKKIQAKLMLSGSIAYVPISVGEAAAFAVSTPVRGVQHLYAVFTNYQTAKESVGGPGAMVEQTSTAVKNGIWQVLGLAGSLSLVLGLMNLLPFPPLDGGQMVIAFIELLRGNRRLPHNLQVALHNIGGMAVMLLMLAAFTLDATRRSEANKPEEKTKVAEPAVKEPEPKTKD